MNERLKNNIAILKRHNLTHEPVYHITDRKKHEVELIDEIVEDCEKIIKDEEQGLIVRLPCKVGTPIFLISNRSLISGKRCLYEGVVRGFVTDGYSTYYNLGLFTKNINSSDIFFTREEAEKKLEEL